MVFFKLGLGLVLTVLCPVFSDSVLISIFQSFSSGEMHIPRIFQFLKNQAKKIVGGI